MARPAFVSRHPVLRSDPSSRDADLVCPAASSSYQLVVYHERLHALTLTPLRKQLQAHRAAQGRQQPCAHTSPAHTRSHFIRFQCTANTSRGIDSAECMAYPTATQYARRWMPTSCGTLNLTHPLTRHCFPGVCCCLCLCSCVLSVWLMGRVMSAQVDGAHPHI